jgi:lysozyme family protein
MTTEQEFRDLQSKTEAELRDVLRNGETREQVRAAEEALQRLHALRSQAILAEFNKATPAFVEYSDLLKDVIDRIQVDSPATPALQTLSNLLAAGSTIYSAIREPERLASATERADELKITLPVRDEQDVPPGAPSAGVAAVEARLPPIDSRNYGDLKDEYVAFFHAAQPRPERAGDLSFYLSKLKQHRARYEAVGDPLHIPWYFIGCIHALEGGFDFNTHMFNGDPLTARTARVPHGQPETPPANGDRYTWEESATAAMKFKGFDQDTDWSLPRLLYRWECYNGLGYRGQGVPTPYLWSFSTLYSKGRFVADHTFDPNAESKQAGAATMLKSLVGAGAVDL